MDAREDNIPQMPCELCGESVSIRAEIINYEGCDVCCSCYTILTEVTDG